MSWQLVLVKLFCRVVPRLGGECALVHRTSYCLFSSSLSVSGNSSISSSLRPVSVHLHVFVQVLYVTVLFGNSLCTFRSLLGRRNIVVPFLL